MTKKFSFIIPTVRQTTMVRDCIQSIKRFQPDQSAYEFVVVDDGSQPPVQEWLKNMAQQEGARFIAKSPNRGFAHTVNVGMANATGDHLVLVNNDLVAIQPFIKQLEASFAADPLIGVVGAKLLYPTMRIQHAGVVRKPKSAFFYHENQGQDRYHPPACRSRYSISVTGALFAIKRSAYLKVGPFNEDYFVACEDTEYCLRTWAAGLRVFYAADVEAIHVEGATRGNNDHSKIEKGKEWFVKERETIYKFNRDFVKFDANGYEAKVRALNEGLTVAATKVAEAKAGVPQAAAPAPRKLEIGSGYNPQPGYEHLDVRPLPDVEYVCDFAREPLPFKDGTFEELLSNHSIEHVSYRLLPFILREWFRVLKPGGRVFLRTPDLRYIAEKYLKGETTPEWPGDEDWIKANLSSQITPAWWANIKLFAGQDYPSNFHCSCFDFEQLKAMLERFGFCRVARLDVQPVFSSGELQVEAFKPEVETKIEVKKPAKVLVKRSGAMGDVLLTTPILARLREDLGSEAQLDVATSCPQVLHANPDINNVVPANYPTREYERVIDLDLAYERRPTMHVIDAYIDVAFGQVAENMERTSVMVSSPDDDEWVDKWLVERGIKGKGLNGLIVVHMAVTWKNRTWSKELWEHAITKLRGYGLAVVAVGAGGDFTFKANEVQNFKGAGPFFDLTNQLSVQRVRSLIARAGCFVGNDSGLLHVAGTTKTPIVGIFTSASPDYRLPYRDGKLGHGCTALTPDIECAGCLHREKPPVVFCDCRRGDFACLGLITPTAVVKAVRDTLK